MPIHLKVVYLKLQLSRAAKFLLFLQSSTILLADISYSNSSLIISHQRCLVRIRSGFCAGQSSSSQECCNFQTEPQNSAKLDCSHIVFFKTLSDLGTAIYQKPTMTRRTQDLNKFDKRPLQNARALARPTLSTLSRCCAP